MKPERIHYHGSGGISAVAVCGSSNGMRRIDIESVTCRVCRRLYYQIEAETKAAIARYRASIAMARATTIVLACALLLTGCGVHHSGKDTRGDEQRPSGPPPPPPSGRVGDTWELGGPPAPPTGVA